MPRNFINWSCKLTLCQRERDGGGGQPPVKSEVRAQSNKVGRLCFLGGRCSRISRGTPEARSCLCVYRASFLMTFVTSGMSLAGSWQPRTNLLEDGLVGSLCSQRDSKESSPTPQFKGISSYALSCLYRPTSHIHT